MGLTLAQLTQAIRHKVDIDMETVVAESIARSEEHTSELQSQ